MPACRRAGRGAGVTAAPRTTGRAAALTAAARSALDVVRDPELDEPVTDLGFVGECAVDDRGRATVRLRLPTYFCAPNFAFLMVADAYDAVIAVDGVAQADVALIDHFASDEINAGVAAEAGFSSSFEGLAEGELEELRVQFLRKAVLAGTDRVCRPLLDAGYSPDDLAALTLGSAPRSGDLDRLRTRRAELGLAAGDDDPLVIDPTGRAVGIEALPLHLRRARTTRVSIEANAGYCRGLLAQRYGS